MPLTPTGNNQVRAIVERIEAINAEIQWRNEDKRDVFREAKGQGWNVKALKEAIRRRSKNPSELSDLDAEVEAIIAALDAPAPARTRARTREEATTSAS